MPFGWTIPRSLGRTLGVRAFGVGALAFALWACVPSSPPPSLPFAPHSAETNQFIQDFDDLFFRIESGQRLHHFTRFDGPVTVRTATELPPQSQADLTDLLARLRGEAGIDIRQTDAPSAQLHVVTVPAAHIEFAAPGAACFIIPGVSTWDGFLRARAANDISWVGRTDRTLVAIFLPQTAPPQEIRDCLHEEIAQALGPLNDVDRLPQTVFNDNNVHSVLTDFDMLMLRAAYDPALASGMARAQVLSALPDVLARLAPRPTRHRAGPAQTGGVDLDETGWSLVQQGRAMVREDPALATAFFETAVGLMAGDPALALPRAHALHGLAWLSFDRGDFEDALALTDEALAVALPAQDAALAAELHLIQWSAFAALHNTAAADHAAHLARASAQYAYGSTARVLDWQKALPHLH